ncbi:NHL repeat-containing protein [Fodinibius salinus]|uniref:NHL repeat-containing protein n=1 Tax=Fodinibius salinus TaxID=860790 RepID=A0A5D3YJK6_9BACT|nr:hypothetical protein [Fodinibius salinus]TYP93630.1 NHL repeat-containing protein [Fodinibius salinus]
MKIRISAIVLTFFLVSNISAQVPKSFYQNYESQPQKTDKRIGLEDSLVSIGPKITLSDFELYELAFLTVDSKGNIAGYDYQLEHIVYFPHDSLSDIKLLGNGVGNGPKEFRYPSDVKFDKDGNIWVTDKNASRITKWSPSGELLKSLPANRNYVRPAKLAVCNFKLYTVSEQYLPSGVMSVLTKGGKLLNSFQKIEDRMQRFPAYMNGEVTCHNENLFIVGSYKNYIRKYDSGGSIIFSRSVQSFEPNKEPMVTKDGKWYTRSDDARRVSGDVWVRNNKLYAGFSGNKNSWYYCLDTYNIEDGGYLRSYIFNHPVEDFTMSDTKIFVIEWDSKNDNRRLAVYKLPN